MGSILDYLTYEYFSQNKITIPNKKRPNFHDRLLYIRQNNLLGNPNDWFIADQILRKYRNFIHLQEMINQNIVLDELTIKTIYPIFERLVLLF